MRSANYETVYSDGNKLVIRDIGLWDQHPTITNTAEQVVAELLPLLNHRRLFYYDSDGEYGELMYKDGKFAGFRPAQ